MLGHGKYMKLLNLAPEEKHQNVSKKTLKVIRTRVKRWFGVILQYHSGVSTMSGNALLLKRLCITSERPLQLLNKSLQSTYVVL